MGIITFAIIIGVFLISSLYTIGIIYAYNMVFNPTVMLTLENIAIGGFIITALNILPILILRR
jgi:hypothetical protein